MTKRTPHTVVSLQPKRCSCLGDHSASSDPSGNETPQGSDLADWSPDDLARAFPAGRPLLLDAFLPSQPSGCLRRGIENSISPFPPSDRPQIQSGALGAGFASTCRIYSRPRASLKLNRIKLIVKKSAHKHLNVLNSV